MAEEEKKIEEKPQGGEGQLEKKAAEIADARTEKTENPLEDRLGSS